MKAITLRSKLALDQADEIVAHYGLIVVAQREDPFRPPGLDKSALSPRE
jgi:hypothetical protein